MNDEDIYPLLSFGGGGNSAQHNGTKTALKQAFLGFTMELGYGLDGLGWARNAMMIPLLPMFLIYSL